MAATQRKGNTEGLVAPEYTAAYLLIKDGYGIGRFLVCGRHFMLTPFEKLFFYCISGNYSTTVIYSEKRERIRCSPLTPLFLP